MKMIVITVLAALATAAATATAVSAQALNLSGQFQCVDVRSWSASASLHNADRVADEPRERSGYPVTRLD